MVEDYPDQLHQHPQLHLHRARDHGPQGRRRHRFDQLRCQSEGEPSEAVYGGIKAGIISFMKTIAKEHGHDGIRCNAVCPGVTIPEDKTEIGADSL